jgi:hypothetical protein
MTSLSKDLYGETLDRPAFPLIRALIAFVVTVNVASTAAMLLSLG